MGASLDETRSEFASLSRREQKAVLQAARIIEYTRLMNCRTLGLRDDTPLEVLKEMRESGVTEWEWLSDENKVWLSTKEGREQHVRLGGRVRFPAEGSPAV
jgi:hypothetical protein